MNKILPYIFFIFLFILLTILTQIGGIAMLLGIYLSKRIDFRFNKLTLSIAAYLLLTFVLVPIIAPMFGRERVKNTGRIKPTSSITRLLNRNYVRPALNELLIRTSEQLPENFEIRYLDANFPFIDRFPLLPHLSHNDGKK